MEKYLIFSLSGSQYALPLVEIERILHAVAISPVPRAPEIVMGLINVQGQVIPVLNIRELFGLPTAEMRLSDQLIIARTISRPVAILVDNVVGIKEFSEQDITDPDDLFPGIEDLEGVAKLNNGIVYIYDLEKLYSSAVAAEIDNLPAFALPAADDSE